VHNTSNYARALARSQQGALRCVASVAVSTFFVGCLLPEVTQEAVAPGNAAQQDVSPTEPRERRQADAKVDAALPAETSAGGSTSSLPPGSTMAGAPSAGNASAATAAGAPAIVEPPTPHGACTQSGATKCFGSSQRIHCNGRKWSGPVNCENGGRCLAVEGAENADICRFLVPECEGQSAGTKVCSVSDILYICEGDGAGQVDTVCADPSPICTGGACGCPETVCDGACVQLSFSDLNCGNCGVRCSAETRCAGSQCIAR
jgi:hypothetical protein